MRLIDTDAWFNFLTEQLEKEIGRYSKGRNDGLNIERLDLYDEPSTPTIAPPPNDPLTLEELRKMDGEPICIAPVDGGPYTWMLVDTKYEVCREAHGGLAVFENLGKTWVAYRHKPENGA